MESNSRTTRFADPSPFYALSHLASHHSTVTLHPFSLVAHSLHKLSDCYEQAHKMERPRSVPLPGFSVAYFRPAPLRLPRNNESSSASSGGDAFELHSKNGYGVGMPAKASYQQIVPRGLKIQDRPSSIHTSAPGLADLVSKFEMLEATSSAKATLHPAGGARGSPVIPAANSPAKRRSERDNLGD